MRCSSESLPGVREETACRSDPSEASCVSRERERAGHSVPAGSATGLGQPPVGGAGRNERLDPEGSRLTVFSVLRVSEVTERVQKCF